MDNEFILDAREYISLDMADHPHPIDHFDPPSSNSMSPVPSAASTPPTTTNTSSTMASFAPVAISSQPSYSPMTMSLPSGYPRRAEHSYLHHPQQQHQHQQQFGHHHHHHQQPYSFGAPPPPPAFPKLRAPQLPTTAIMQTAAVHPPSSNNNNVSDLALSSSANEPDAPPSGTGGSRKRPKYTRSKKGCLTCRSKKIKCDERKPMCTRCEHGHRECTWPEAVLPRRPKGAVRGVGDEGDGTEDDQIIDQQQQRRPSIPGSAVSTQFPSSATSTHFNGGIPTNSPFEPAPPRSGRDVFESDVYPAPGSQFSMPAIPANARSLYPRAPGSADFYPVTTVNGQPIDDYEFPPRQQQQPFGSGASSSRSGYTNNALYATGPPGAVPAASYNGDLRRASWDSSAPTDGRRPSWDANSMGAHASSVSSPASSTLGLGLGGIIPRAGSSNAGGSGATAGPNNNGLMLFQSPDPLSPFFRSVQERNLVGNISSFDPTTSSSSFSFNNLSPFSSSPATSSSSASSHYSMVSPASYDASTIPAVAQHQHHNFTASSPVLSNASSSDFGITPEGVAYRKNSYPHLFFSSSSPSSSTSCSLSSQPLTIDPPAPIAPQGVDLRRPSVDLLSLAEKTGNKPDSEVEWLAPPSMDVARPFSSYEEESFASSWSAAYS